MNKYLHTVASVGFLFTSNYDARNHELKICLLDVVILNRRHVSAPALAYLQVTKTFIRGNYTVCHKIYQSKIQRTLVVVQYSNAVHDLVMKSIYLTTRSANALLSISSRFISQHQEGFS